MHKKNKLKAENLFWANCFVFIPRRLAFGICARSAVKSEAVPQKAYRFWYNSVQKVELLFKNGII